MDNCSTTLPREISFSHNGEAITAVLVEAPTAGGKNSEEMCSICKEPLGNHSFYTAHPRLFYVHAHCLSAEKSRRIPHFPSAPPLNVISYPSYYNYNSYPSSYQPNYNHPTSYQPPQFSYHNQLHQGHNNPPPYIHHAGYQYHIPPYNQFPPPPPPHHHHHHHHSSSSTALSVAGSLLQAFFSSIFS